MLTMKRNRNTEIELNNEKGIGQLQAPCKHPIGVSKTDGGISFPLGNLTTTFNIYTFHKS